MKTQKLQFASTSIYDSHKNKKKRPKMIIKVNEKNTNIDISIH